MYQAIYRTYRPETFDEVLGQDPIVNVLKNQVATGTTSHAYLFCGTRGTGKTTVARILAKAVNCEAEGDRPCGVCENCRSIQDGTFMDLIEIDAASNNGVENIRELRESVQYLPTKGKCKVYIMDEVHMLSNSAFNALLKTLEEPPENVMFILCTTEPEKLPATVLSRCMRMDFRRVPESLLKSRMAGICSDRGVSVDENGLALIASLADGSVRDGLSLLEQAIAGRQGQVSRDQILDALGTVGEEAFIDLTEAARAGQVAEGLVLIDDMLSKGKDARQIMQGWMGHYRNLLLARYIENPEEIISMSTENLARIRRQTDDLELGDITGAIRELSQMLFDAKRSSQPRILLEMAMVKLASGDASEEEITRAPRRVRVAPKAVAEAAPISRPAPVAEEPAAMPVVESAPEPVVAASVAEPAVEPAPVAEPAPAFEAVAESAPTVEPAPAFESAVPAEPVQDEMPIPQTTVTATPTPAVDPAPAMETPTAMQGDTPGAPAEDPLAGQVAFGLDPGYDASLREVAPPEPAPTESILANAAAAVIREEEERIAMFADGPAAAPAQGELHMTAVEKTPAAPAMPDVALEDLWESFLSNGEKTIGNMFFSVRDSARAVAIEGDTVVIEVTGGAKGYMEDNMDRMTKLMSAVWGQDAKIKLRAPEKPAEEDPAEEDKQEELRALASSVLGVDVKFQD